MKLSSSDSDGIPVLHLHGEFDIFETPTLEEDLAGRVARGTARVVIDLTQVSFVNSSTLAFFIRAQRTLREKGGEVVLANPRRHLHRTLTTLGLAQVFRIVGSVSEAVAALRPS